jgi:hypothetical protein
MKMTITSRILLLFAVLGWFQGITSAQTKGVANVDMKQSFIAPAYSNVDVQLADTLRQLRRIRLEHAIQINSRARGTFSANEIDTLKEELAVIDHQEGRSGEAIDSFSTMLGLAEAWKSVADADCQRASTLRKLNPQSLPEFDVEIACLLAHLADQNLQRGRLAAKGTAEDRQNWALLFITMEIQQLKDQTRILDARTR